MDLAKAAPLSTGNLNRAAVRQNPKAEGRRPKEIRRPKVEGRNPSQTIPPWKWKTAVSTARSKTWRNFQELRALYRFGPRSSAFFRISALDLRIFHPRRS